MKAAYPHLMSPVTVPVHTLKSHLISLCSQPPELQGPEPYPTDAIISHYISRARRRVAMMTLLAAKVGVKHPLLRMGLLRRPLSARHFAVDRRHPRLRRATRSADIPELDVSNSIPSFFIRGDGSASGLGGNAPSRCWSSSPTRWCAWGWP